MSVRKAAAVGRGAVVAVLLVFAGAGTSMAGAAEAPPAKLPAADVQERLR